MEAATLAAMGEPSRLRIVEFLRGGPSSVNDIADALAMRQPQVSKHLRVLGQSDIVSKEAVGRLRIYHLEAPPFEEVGRWVDSFDRLWETRLDALGSYLDSIEGSRD